MTAYAAHQGTDREMFVAGLQPIVTAAAVAQAVIEVAGIPGSAGEYLLSGAGLRPVG